MADLLLHGLDVGLPLLPSLVYPEERSNVVHPLYEARACPQWDHRVVLRLVELGLVSAGHRGGRELSHTRNFHWVYPTLYTYYMKLPTVHCLINVSVRPYHNNSIYKSGHIMNRKL